jgi:hypothetical protein
MFSQIEVLMFIQKRMRLISSIVLCFLCFLISTSIAAQEAVTPTPAPSKTPIAASDELQEPSNQTVQTPIGTRIQSDLSILTGNVQRPNGIVWHDGKLYTSCNGDFTIYEIDATTAATRTYIWGVRNAHMLYAENTPEGELNIWAPDFQANQLVRIDRNGVETILSNLESPWGIAYLNENEFLVSGLRSNNLLVVSRDGQSREIVSDLRSPTGLAADDSAVYIANTGSARRAIEWIDKADIPEQQGESEGAEPIQVHSLISGLQNTTGLVMAADGYLYFAYSLGTRGVVGRVDPEVCRQNGGCTNAQVEIVLYTELAAPLAGLTISPDMRLFVHTIFSPDIYWVQLDNKPLPVEPTPTSVQMPTVSPEIEQEASQ